MEPIAIETGQVYRTAWGHTFRVMALSLYPAFADSALVQTKTGKLLWMSILPEYELVDCQPLTLAEEIEVAFHGADEIERQAAKATAEMESLRGKLWRLNPEFGTA